MSENPTVERINTGNGSYVEPPLDSAWSDLDKLRWHLAVALHDAGKPADLLQIEPDDSRIIRPTYRLYWSGGGMSSMSYGSMWTFINGLSLGFDFAARRPSAPAGHNTTGAGR